MALPTKGRVIIDTTVGEIDIELWSKVRDRVLPSLWDGMLCATSLNSFTCRKHRKRVGTLSHWLWRVCEFSRPRACTVPLRSITGNRILRRRHIPPVSHCLCLEYEGLIRCISVIPGFLVQTGDKTGTGGGGESFFGGMSVLSLFPDSNEIESRGL